MKIRNCSIFVIIALKIIILTVDAEQYKTLAVRSPGANNDWEYSETLTLSEGQAAEVLFINYYVASNGDDSDTSPSISFQGIHGIGSWKNSIQKGDVIAGPATIAVRARWLKSCAMSLRIYDSDASSLNRYTTVIPENLSVNARIRLQQSTDLINWTDVAPGEFAPSTGKRFFRVSSELVQTAPITGATSANPIVITATAHGFTTGDQVQISGVLGNTTANGTFSITVIDANSFSLNGADGSTSNAYTSGGTAKKL